MDNFVNSYFERMHRIAVDYELQKEVRLEERSYLLQRNDHEALDRWQQREDTIPFPFSRGETNAYKAWSRSKKYKTEVLECCDMPWSTDIPDFISILKNAKVRQFVITDRGVCLLESLVSLMELGCNVIGAKTVIRHEQNGQKETELKISGILIEVPDKE